MSELSKIKKELSQLEKTERELNLKQLQINGLLGITQAINNNVSADGLYEMYASFVAWEMAVEKLAIFRHYPVIWLLLWVWVILLV